MTDTDFFVAVQGEPSPQTCFTNARRVCASTKQDLVQQIVGVKTHSMLVLAFADDAGRGKQVCKDLFMQFAQKAVTPPGSYTQFTLYFADDATGDLIQCRCDRMTDIDAFIEEEGREHVCASLCISTVTPNNVSFDFSDARMTLVSCTQNQYEGNSLVLLARDAADAMGARFKSVCVLLPDQSMSTVDPQRITSAVDALNAECRAAPIGHDERVSVRGRLQDIRAWSQSVNELYRFAAAEPGPCFASLNPQFVVGEKLLHAVPEGVTYLVGDGTVASAWDFVALPLSAEKDKVHPSVYSPHLRITRDGVRVRLKPECGMTYVNGELLRDEKVLESNDRIIIGKQLAFRYVYIASVAPASSSSRILDWELCSKEFRQVSETKLSQGGLNQLESDNRDLRRRVDTLEQDLANKNGDSWLVLHNPPSSYSGRFLWPLDLSAQAVKEVTLGPSASTVEIPFLTASASLRREGASVVFRCDNASVPLSDGSRFAIGPYFFSVCLNKDVAPRRSSAMRVEDASGSIGDEVRALRLSCFDMQWAVALLFDFAFPPDTLTDAEKGYRTDDTFREYRKDLCEDTIMTGDTLTVPQLTALNQQLTNAIRMAGAGMAKEVNSAYIGSDGRADAAKIKSRAEGKLCDSTRAFFEKVKSSKDISADLAQRYHHEVGTFLVEQMTSTGNAATAEPRTKRSTHTKSKSGKGSSTGGANGRQTSSTDRVPLLLNLSLLSSNGGAGESHFGARLTELKGFCFLASPQVIRRAGGVMDVLSISPNPKALWEKYLKVLTVLPVPSGSLVFRQNYFLAILDVLLSTEFCVTRDMLSKSEVKHLSAKMDLWQSYLIDFASSFDEPAQIKRTSWRRDAAAQKGATPRLRETTVKASRGELGTSGSVFSGLTPIAAKGDGGASPRGAKRASQKGPKHATAKDPATKLKRAQSATATSARGTSYSSPFGGSVKSPSSNARGTNHLGSTWQSAPRVALTSHSARASPLDSHAHVSPKNAHAGSSILRGHVSPAKSAGRGDSIIKKSRTTKRRWIDEY